MAFFASKFRSNKKPIKLSETSTSRQQQLSEEPNDKR